MAANAANIKGLMYWWYWYVIFNDSVFLILKVPDLRREDVVWGNTKYQNKNCVSILFWVSYGGKLRIQWPIIS